VTKPKIPPRRKTSPPFRKWPEELLRDRSVSLAHHEAGHALAHLFLGHTVHRAVLRTATEFAETPDPSPAEGGARIGIQMGRVEAQGPPNFVHQSRSETEERLRGAGNSGLALDLWMRRARAWVEMDLLILLAGPVAQALYEQRPLEAVLWDDAPASDVEKVHQFLDGWFEATERERLCARMTGLAESLIRSPRGRKFVDAFATLLLYCGDVDGETATEMFERLYGYPAPTWLEWTPCWLGRAPTRSDMRRGWLPPPPEPTPAEAGEMAEADAQPF
jgi:hypothetical protein